MEHVCQGALVVSDSVQPSGLYLPGSSVLGILQVRTLEWACHALLQGALLTQGLNPALMSPAVAGRFFTTSATWEAQSGTYMMTKGQSTKKTKQSQMYAQNNSSKACEAKTLMG